MMFEIDPRKFYLIGMILLFIMGVANLTSMIFYWPVLDWMAITSRSAGVCFNFLLFGFFVYLFRQMPKPQPTISEKELEEVFKSGKSL